MIKLVAFDWNGTLFADTNTCLTGANAILKFLGAKPLTLYQYQKYFIIPTFKFYEQLGFKKEEILKKSAKIAQTFHTTYEPRTSKLRTRKGAKKALSFLHKNKVECVIFSNHIDKEIKKQLKRLKIQKYFSHVLANPHQESSIKIRIKEKSLIDYISKKLYRPNQIVVVGDTQEEVEIGKKIGTVTVAITGGNYSTPRLKAAKPDYLISDLGNLINIINEINTA